MRFWRTTIFPALALGVALTACGNDEDAEESELNVPGEGVEVVGAETETGAVAGFDPVLDANANGVLDPDEGLGDADADGVLDRDEAYTP